MVAALTGRRSIARRYLDLEIFIGTKMGSTFQVEFGFGIKNPISTSLFTYSSIQTFSSAEYLLALTRTRLASF